MDVFARVMSFIRNCKKLTNLSDSAPLQPTNGTAEQSGDDLSSPRQTLPPCVCGRHEPTNNSSNGNAVRLATLEENGSANGAGHTVQSCPSSPARNGSPGSGKIAGKFAVNILSPTICLSTVSVRQCLDVCKRQADSKLRPSTTLPSFLAGVPGQVDVCIVQPRTLSGAAKCFHDWRGEEIFRNVVLDRSLSDTENVEREWDVDSSSLELNCPASRVSQIHRSSTCSSSLHSGHSSRVPVNNADATTANMKKSNGVRSTPVMIRQSSCVSFEKGCGNEVSVERQDRTQQKRSRRMRSRLPILESSPANVCLVKPSVCTMSSRNSRNRTELGGTPAEQNPTTKVCAELTVTKSLGRNKSNKVGNGSVKTTQPLGSSFTSDSDARGRSQSHNGSKCHTLPRHEDSSRRTRSSLPVFGSLSLRKNSVSQTKPSRNDISLPQPGNCVSDQDKPKSVDGAGRKTSQGSLKSDLVCQTVSSPTPLQRKADSTCRSPRSSSLKDTKSSEEWNLPEGKERSKSQEDRRRDSLLLHDPGSVQGSPVICRRSCHCSRHSHSQNTDTVEWNHVQPGPPGNSPFPETPTKPWAKTLREYEKSPSPVRSRKSTPENAVPSASNVNHTVVRNITIHLQNPVPGASKERKESVGEDHIVTTTTFDSVLNSKQKQSDTSSVSSSRTETLKTEVATVNQKKQANNAKNKMVKSLLPVKARKTNSDSCSNKRHSYVLDSIPNGPESKTGLQEAKQDGEILSFGTSKSKLPVCRNSTKEQISGTQTSQKRYYFLHQNSDLKRFGGTGTFDSGRKIFADPSDLRNQLPTEETLDMLLAISPAVGSLLSTKSSNKKLASTSTDGNEMKSRSEKLSKNENDSGTVEDKNLSKSVEGREISRLDTEAKQVITGFCKFDKVSSDIVVEKRSLEVFRNSDTHGFNSDSVTVFDKTTKNFKNIDEEVEIMTNEPFHKRKQADRKETGSNSQTPSSSMLQNSVIIPIENKTVERDIRIAHVPKTELKVDHTSLQQTRVTDTDPYLLCGQAIKVIGQPSSLIRSMPEENGRLTLDGKASEREDISSSVETIGSVEKTITVTTECPEMTNSHIKKILYPTMPPFGQRSSSSRSGRFRSLFSRNIGKLSGISGEESGVHAERGQCCTDKLNEPSFPVQRSGIETSDDSMDGKQIYVEHMSKGNVPEPETSSSSSSSSSKRTHGFECSTASGFECNKSSRLQSSAQSNLEHNMITQSNKVSGFESNEYRNNKVPGSESNSTSEFWSSETVGFESNVTSSVESTTTSGRVVEADEWLINPILSRDRPFQKSFSFIDSIPELIGMRLVNENRRLDILRQIREKSSFRENLVSSSVSSEGTVSRVSNAGKSKIDSLDSVLSERDPAVHGGPVGTSSIVIDITPERSDLNETEQIRVKRTTHLKDLNVSSASELTYVRDLSMRETTKQEQVISANMNFPASHADSTKNKGKETLATGGNSVDSSLKLASSSHSYSDPPLPPPPLHCSSSDAVLTRQERRLDTSCHSDTSTSWYISDIDNTELLDQLMIHGSCSSLPNNLKRKPTLLRGQRPVLRPRSAEYAKRKSPELSCFRKSRALSPDSDDDLDARERKFEETYSNSCSLPAHSRLFQKIFSYRGGTCSKESYALPFGNLQSPVSTSAESSLSREGDTSMDRDADQELNVRINHYRSLSRKGGLPYFSSYGDPCHTPPLAVFLSNEDISASVFPLRHVVSEPVTNQPFMQGYMTDKAPPVAKERPRSDCFDAKWASHLRHRLNSSLVKESPKFVLGGKELDLSRSRDGTFRSSSLPLRTRSAPGSQKRQQLKWMSQPHLIKCRSELRPPRTRLFQAKKSLSLPENLPYCPLDQTARLQRNGRHSVGAKVDYFHGNQMVEFSSDEDLSVSFVSEASDRSFASITDRQTSLCAESRSDSNAPVLAEALWDHVTLDQEELSFQSGDVIDVIDVSDRDWWWGRSGRQSGWFPASFVRIRAPHLDMGNSFEGTLSKSFGRSPFLHTRAPSVDRSRLNVIREIMKAENDYVKHLRDVVEGYLERARKHPDMFTDERIATIFGNIDDIYNFSRNFLSELEKRILTDLPELSEIGQCFINNRKGFEIYSEYCNNHPLATEELCGLQQQEKYSRFFEMCRLQQKMIEIPLEGFLLTPIQKICKYPLQLKELIKYTLPGHPDYSSLQRALETMKEIAALINERKRKMESLEKLAHWQTTVAGWQGLPLVETSSELIYSGELTKINARGWHQERVFFLFDHQIIYCKKDLLWRHMLIYRGRIDIDHCVIHLVPDGKDVMFGIYVKNAWKLYDHQKDKWYLLTSRSAKERDRWLQAFDDERKRVTLDRESGFSLTDLKRPMFFPHSLRNLHSKKSNDKQRRKRVTIQKSEDSKRSLGFPFSNQKS